MEASGYKIRNQGGIHFITFAVVEWVDVFSRKEYQEIVIESLRYCQREKGLVIYAWCLMSNHMHLIVSAKEENLGDILRDFKKFTSRTILNEVIQNKRESRKKWLLDIFRRQGLKSSRNKVYQLWCHDNHPKELFSERFTEQKLHYIHNNPVAAGLVEKAEDYLLSSAKNYHLGEKSLINVAFI